MITFEEAKNYRITFGKYVGKTLDEIAKSDEGLRYLDRMVDMTKGKTHDHLEVYLGDPAIAREVDRLTDEPWDDDRGEGS